MQPPADRLLRNAGTKAAAMDGGSSNLLFCRRPGGGRFCDWGGRAILFGGHSTHSEFAMASGNRRADFARLIDLRSRCAFALSQYASRFQDSKPNVGRLVDPGGIFQ